MGLSSPILTTFAIDCTGSSTGTEPDWATRIAASTAQDYPLPHMLFRKCNRWFTIKYDHQCWRKWSAGKASQR